MRLNVCLSNEMDTCVLVCFTLCSPFNKYTTPVVGNIARFFNDPIANKYWPSIADTDTIPIVPPVNIASKSELRFRTFKCFSEFVFCQ